MTEKNILFGVELVALLGCIVLGGFWIKHPNDSYGIYFSISMIIFIATEIFRRRPVIKRKGNIGLCIDSQDTFFSHFKNRREQTDLDVCIVFYGMSLINNAEFNVTIKSVELGYSYNDKDYLIESIVLIPITVDTKLEKNAVDSIVVNTKSQRIFCMNWINLRQEINRNNVLLPGAVLRASSLFVLEIKELSEIEKLSNFRIIITDFNKTQSIHKIEIKNEWIDIGHDSYIDYYEYENKNYA